MVDNDTTGTRGRKAERQFVRAYRGKARIDHTPSQGHDFVIKCGRRERYVDIKEANTVVRSGRGRTERGRVQLERSEVDRWAAWERRKPGRRAVLVVALRDRLGRLRWKRGGVDKIRRLMRRREDPVKLTPSDLQQLDDFRPGERL